MVKRNSRTFIKLGSKIAAAITISLLHNCDHHPDHQYHTRLQYHDNQHPWCAAQRHFPLGFWIWQSRDRYETSPGWNCRHCQRSLYCELLWTWSTLWLIVTACAKLQNCSFFIVLCQIILSDQIMTSENGVPLKSIVIIM